MKLFNHILNFKERNNHWPRWQTLWSSKTPKVQNCDIKTVLPPRNIYFAHDDDYDDDDDIDDGDDDVCDDDYDDD